MALGKAHNVITPDDLKELKDIPSHELVNYHIHKLVQVTLPFFPLHILSLSLSFSLSFSFFFFLFNIHMWPSAWGDAPCHDKVSVPGGEGSDGQR